MQQETNRKPRFRAYVFILLLGLAVGLTLAHFYMNVRLNQTKAELAAAYTKPAKTDTVVVHRIYRDTVRVVVRSRPKTVFVYSRPDTLRRQRLEHDTLIAGVRINSESLEVERLTPRGISLVDNYQLASIPVVVGIQHGGQVEIVVDKAQLSREKRRRRWKRVGMAACFAVGLVVGGAIR